MKLLLIVFASLVLSNTTFAQSKEGEAQEPPSNPAVVPKLTTQQSAELAEARRMSAEVVTLYNRGKYDDALALATSAVEIRERVLGADHQLVAEALRNLAELYVAKRKYDKAEPIFLRAISIEDKPPYRSTSPTSSTLERYICFLYQTRTVDEAQKTERKLTQDRLSKFVPQPVSGLSGGVLNGRAISLPQPAYPEEASRMRAYGVVRIHVLIDETGKVVEAKVLCGHPIFAKPSLEAAYRARFSPTKLSGMPVKVNGVIVYNFTR